MPPRTREEALADPKFQDLDADVQAEVLARLPPGTPQLTQRGSAVGEEALRAGMEQRLATSREQLMDPSMGEVAKAILRLVMTGPGDFSTSPLPTTTEEQLAQLGTQRPGGGQTIADTIMSTIGGMAGGQKFGIPGAMIGAGVGAIGGPLIRGEPPSQALAEGTEAALWQGGGDVASRAILNFLRPGVSPQSQRLLQRGGAESVAEQIAAGPRIDLDKFGTGALAQRVVTQSRELEAAVAGRAYLPVVSAIEQVEPMIDITRIEQAAARLNLALADTGVEIVQRQVPAFTRPPGQIPVGQAPAPVAVQTVVTPENSIRLRSNLLSQGRKLEDLGRAAGRNIERGASNKLAHMVDQVIEDAADRAGVRHEWRQANAGFRQNVAAKFYSEAVDRVLEASPEQFVDELLQANTTETQQIMGSLRNAQGHLFPQGEEVQARAIGSILSQATTKSRGVLSPARLANAWHSPQMDISKRQAIWGTEFERAFSEFVKNLNSAQYRGELGFLLGGPLTVATAAAGPIGSASAGAGAGVETMNEFGIVGRLMLNRPKTMRVIANAIITGNAEPLKRTGLGHLIHVVRVGGVQGAREMLGGSPLLNAFQSDDVPLEQKIGMSQQLLPRPVTR